MQVPQKLRAAGYFRVSSEDQLDNWSLDAQERAFIEFCNAKGWEPVLDGKRLVGATASGGYAHTLGHGIALAYVRPELARPGTPLSVEILGDVRPATVLEDPPYDPANERLRADG